MDKTNLMPQATGLVNRITIEELPAPKVGEWAELPEETLEQMMGGIIMPNEHKLPWGNRELEGLLIVNGHLIGTVYR